MKNNKIKNNSICHPEQSEGSHDAHPVILSAAKDLVPSANRFFGHLSLKMTGESGRSMVEMLGVLAIIGVISVGGIAGYIYGMNKYRTNEILDGGNKRAYTVATQLSMGIPVDLSEFSEHDVTPGGIFKQTVQDWESEFGLEIDGVTKPVCENLIRMIGNHSTLRAITTTANEKEDLTLDKCGEENNLYLVYNTDMAADDANSSAQSSNGSGSNNSSSAVTASSSAGPICGPQQDYCEGNNYYCESGFCACKCDLLAYPNCNAPCTCNAENTAATGSSCNTSTYECSSGFCWCLNPDESYPACTSTGTGSGGTPKTDWCHPGDDDCMTDSYVCYSNTKNCECIDSTKTYPNCGGDPTFVCNEETSIMVPECITYTYRCVSGVCNCFDTEKEYPNC